MSDAGNTPWWLWLAILAILIVAAVVSILWNKKR